jgi:CheY-like chemotaxis protein
MDIRLPGDLDGIDAGRVLHERFGLPVIYLTGHADESTLQRALDTQPAGFLVKPSSTQEIRAAVEVALREHATADGVPSVPFDREAMERQLTIAERQALIGSLTSGMAHEINNPLTYVSANAEYISRRLASFERRLAGAIGLDEVRQDWERGRDEMVSALEDIKQGGLKVGEIVSDLKGFANPDEVLMARVDVATVIQRAARLTHHRLKHLARVELDVQPDCVVNVNEAALGYVIVCILVEAGRAITTGRPEQNEIRIGCRREDGNVRIEIRDTCGLTEEAFAHAVELPHGAAVRRPRCICVARIRSLGGLTELEATTRGCVVTLRFPAAEFQAERATRAQILVLDDEELVGRTLQRTLREEHDVTVMTDARAAVEQLLAGKTFDLILCDLSMSGMSGQQCYEAVRRQRPALADRFVFITGGASDAAQAFLDSVSNARTEKPFDPDNLRTQVREWVRRS